MTFLKKINVVLLLVILTLSLFAPGTLLAEQGSEVVATVNGVAITRDQFYTLLENQYGFFALQELVQDEIIRQRAEQLGVTLDEEEFGELLDMVIAQLGGMQGLYMFLMQNNVSEEAFIAQLKWNMLIGQLARAEVEVEEGAVEAFFQENRSSYDQPETVEVSHILVDTEEEANEVLELLKDGGDLITLAEEYSLDPGTAQQGGYLGHIQRGLTVEEFEEMAFALPVGEYGITESQYGWHVIIVHAKNEAKEAVFADLAEEVERDYRGSKALDLESYLYLLEQESDIQVQWEPKEYAN